MALDLARIGRLHVGLVGTSGGLAYATQWGGAGSVLLGGAVMGVNVVLLKLITNAISSAATNPDKPRRAELAVGAFVVKFGLFLVLLAGLFWRLPIDGMSFAFGATLLLVAVVVEALRSDPGAVKGVR